MDTVTLKIAVTSQQGERIALALESLVRIASHFVGPPKPRGPLTFTPTGEDEMALKFKALLPQLPDVPEAADVVRGELIMTVAGVEQPPIVTQVGQALVEEVRIPQGAEYSAKFQFVDDAGNPSVHPILAGPFTAVDTIPAPDPVGGLGFELTGEDQD